MWIHRINKESDAVRASVDAELKKSKDKLSVIKTENLSLEKLTRMENEAKNNICKALEKVYLDYSSVKDSQSSLGYCGYTHNCLITSLNLSIMSSDSAVKKVDVIKHFKDYDIQIFDYEILENIFKRLQNPKVNAAVDMAHAKRFTEHFSIVSECIENPLKISRAKIIKKKNIAYYRIEGESQFVSEVKGGGANLAGAVYGGIIAGGAGAVVGSQLGTDIKTEIVKKDDRKLFLYYYVDGALTSEEIISDNIDNVLSLLREWMPDKEYSYVVANNNSIPTKSETKSLPHYDTPRIEEQAAPVKRSYAELKELKELLDLGIITQAEFDQKKREILG